MYENVFLVGFILQRINPFRVINTELDFKQIQLSFCLQTVIYKNSSFKLFSLA